MAFGGFFGGGGSNNNNNDNNSTDTTQPSSDSNSSIPSSSTPFSIGSITSPPANSSSHETKTRLQTLITNQTNIVNAKYLISKINENCFEHCVPDPGTSLSGRESTCLSTCMEKYIESWNTVSKTYVARLQKEGAALGAAGLGGGAPGGREMF